MRKSKIKSIEARKILDSRGNPTIEVLVKADDFIVKAGVPSGASVGKYEAKTLKVSQARENVNEIIGPRLKGLDPINQREIDEILIQLDGTKDKSKLGANAICGVSLAICRAGARARNFPLWQYINTMFLTAAKNVVLASPCFNIINGGAHAKNRLDIQEFMIVPQFEKFSENFQLAKKIYQKLGQIIKKEFDRTKVGDEGGFSPPISQAGKALKLIKEASDEFKNIKIILDCAASQFQKGNKYKIEGKMLSKEELLNYYQELIAQYPIIGLEDPFGEEDFEGWQALALKSKIKNQKPKILFIGDDLTVTNPERIKTAKKKNLCNGMIIKINQIGTVSEAIEAVKLAKSFGWKTIVSHRSGETLDDFISDFAVGVGADFIKSGAPARPERLTKYNRLLQIEKELK